MGDKAQETRECNQCTKAQNEQYRADRRTGSKGRRRDKTAEV